MSTTLAQSLPVVKFDVCVSQWVVLESHQVQMEDGREADKYHTLLRFLRHQKQTNKQLNHVLIQ